MTKSIFEHQDYKLYLGEAIALRPGAGRGERSRIASYLKCNPAYVTQVLSGSAHFNLEQSLELNRYFGHTEEESDHFLQLVLLARAGTPALRQYYGRKLKESVERRGVLKNRLEFKKMLSKENQVRYYSAWYYAAIHLLLSIPRFQTKESLAIHLRVSVARVTQVLEFLVETGLAVQQGNRFKAGATNVHLGNDSGMIAKHHTNWRMKAIQSLERDAGEELHYSSAVTISAKDLPRVRELLVSAIEEVRKVVRDSPEEDLYCYAMDLFKVCD